MFSNINRLLEQADKSCCGLVQANGYYSFARLIFRFFECLNKVLDKECRHHGDHRHFIENFSQLSAVLQSLNRTICCLLDDTNLEDETKLHDLEQELLNYPELHRRILIFRQIMVTKGVLEPNSSHMIDQNSNNSNELKSLNDNTNQSFDNNHHMIKNENNSFSKTSYNAQFNSLPLLSPHLKTIFESVYDGIVQPNTSNKDILFREHFMFWIDSGLLSFFRFFIFLLPFLRVRLYQYPHLIFGSKFRSKIQNKITTTGVTQQFPFECWNLADLKVSLLYVKYKTRNTNTKSREIFIPTQSSIEILQSSQGELKINDMDEIKFNKDITIRCKYIKPKNIDIAKCNRLVLHFHGGGFFSQSCDSHEIYLRSWVYYNEIPILTVAYKVKRAFPVGIQDAFDVYLWLRQAPKQDVISKLGFYPYKIVIVGDSAGGNLAFGITLALNDLQNDYKSEFQIPIPLPDGVVLIYPPLLINTSIGPSRALSSVDTLVPLAVQLVIVYGISGLIPGLRPNTPLEALKTYLFPFQDPKPWFDCTKNEFKDRVIFLAKNVTSPYLTPLFYEKYSSLTDVPIHVVSAEYCSFLDESITLAKIYKGRIKVDVIPDMCHGFLNLRFVGKRANNATMFCCQIISDMFDHVDHANSPTVSARKF